MQLNTTFRGLNRTDAAVASRTLKKQIGRLDRLADETTVLRAVVDGSSPETRVILSLSEHGEEFNAQSNDYELSDAISTACERLRSQLVRHRNRRGAQRHRRSTE
ncbi:MAG: HPF/RaiA family ribosome-associated protein [Pseudomonadota bacterium]